MCGIFGVYSAAKDVSSGKAYLKSLVRLESLEPILKKMFQQSLSRGSEAAGLALLPISRVDTPTRVKIAKSQDKASHFFSSAEYVQLKQAANKTPIRAIIGHSRLATNGTHRLQMNNQPVVSQKATLIGVHNGIVTNTQLLAQSLPKSYHTPELDTQLVLDYLERDMLSNQVSDPLLSIQSLFYKAEGTLNLAILVPNLEGLILASNHGSLYSFETDSELTFFASEKVFLEVISPSIERFLGCKVIGKPTKVATPILLAKNQPKNIKKLSPQPLIFASPDLQVISSNLNSISTLRKHTIDLQKISAIPRCSRCILPATTPFIEFDDKGVCNYCREHKKITHHGKDKLEEILEKNRKGTGEPDCMVAFSGGRDSSYGLHLLKEEFGMQPLAFTYDWGMISDLGRRNQARMLGALGVEHILVSANIAEKRKHIKENILAWMKKPTLGMVPLFMEGDKQCELHADMVMKRYKIPLMIYCRGNDLEKDEFKAGHSGVKDADPGGVIHHLSFAKKMTLLYYYGSQYLKNPSYLNSSLVDTGLGYYSTYIRSHNYAYLWHYIPWNEAEINKTLIEKYNWETAVETPTTWRIGDGTPAFYNYIYYQVQGFTENDSLRARQVREGILSRSEAIDLVVAENQPQYKALKWYFDSLEIDGNSVLSVVDSMPKLY